MLFDPTINNDSSPPTCGLEYYVEVLWVLACYRSTITFTVLEHFPKTSLEHYRYANPLGKRKSVTVTVNNHRSFINSDCGLLGSNNVQLCARTEIFRSNMPPS
jgi:hypothetical protein